MKFLCVQCDQAMKLKEVKKHEDIGSLSVIFECAQCLYDVAMLTNPQETQLVSSLGVKIGASQSAASAGCPFATMLSGEANSGTGWRWEKDASERLEKVPQFVRSFAKQGVEEFARERGFTTITVEILEQARAAIGLFT